MQYTIRCMILFAAMLFIAGVPKPALAQHDAHNQPSQGAAPQPGTNPLIEEMLVLDGVYREVVSAVALGDGTRVHTALESMHGTMEKTHEGVHGGSVVIPKNATRVKEFVQMDREFHEKLESLAGAAHRNDQKNMLKLTKQLLDDCVRCHEMFRK